MAKNRTHNRRGTYHLNVTEDQPLRACLVTPGVFRRALCKKGYMTTSDKIELITKALCELQLEIKDPEKNAKNPHYKNDYADLTSIVQANRKCLAKHGLVVIQGSGITEGIMYLCTLVSHISGQWIRSEYLVLPEKPGPQQLGSAFTYARRYSQRGMLNVADADDDGEQATHRGAHPPSVSPTDRGVNAPPKPLAPRRSEPVIQGPQGMQLDVLDSPWPEEQVPVNESGKYVIGFSKHKGKALNDLGPDNVLGFMNWLKNSAKKENKDLSSEAQDFIRYANLYLASAKEEDGVPF